MSREHVRNSSRQNKIATMSSANNGSSFLPELSDVSGREETKSPLAGPKKLNIQSKIRIKNGPTPIDTQMMAQSFNDRTSGNNSPITPSKAFV